MREIAALSECTPVEGPKGIFRTTLAYNAEAMICHFALKKDAVIPLHSHPAVQIGYSMKGRVRFARGGEGKSFIVQAGSSWVFQANELHGATVLEDSEVIECFTPQRPEYAP